MQQLHLTTNICLQSQLNFQIFSLDIGEGKTSPKLDLPLKLVALGNPFDSFINAISNDPVHFAEHVNLAVRYIK